MATNSDTPDLFRLVPFQGQISFARLDWTRQLAGVDLAIFGMPQDLGTTNRPGARFGPRAIREASVFVGAIGVTPPHDKARYEEMAAIDYGDIEFEVASIEAFMTATRQHVGLILDAGVSPLGLGSDHFSTYPEILACADKHGAPLSLVHFDAHADDYDLPGLNHGNLHFELAEKASSTPRRP